MTRKRTRRRRRKAPDRAAPPRGLSIAADGRRLLAQLLATSDALRLPIRKWSGLAPLTVAAGRERFAIDGVRWASGGETSRDWVAVSRALTRLEADGLAVRCGVGRAKLTDDGDALARELCGLPSLRDAADSARELACETEPDGATLDRVWRSERDLSAPLPSKWTFGERCARVENELLPAIAGGYVAAHSDVRGRGYFALTPPGWRWIRGGDAPEKYDDETTRKYTDAEFSAVASTFDIGAAVAEYRATGAAVACPDDAPAAAPSVPADAALRGLYFATRERALAGFNAPSLRRERTNLALIPLPVAMFGVPCGNWSLRDDE